jgi:hypothetical protein
LVFAVTLALIAGPAGPAGMLAGLALGTSGHCTSPNDPKHSHRFCHVRMELHRAKGMCLLP